jgi:hypothetical protein
MKLDLRKNNHPREQRQVSNAPVMSVADIPNSLATDPGELFVRRPLIVPPGRPDHPQKQARSRRMGQLNQQSQKRREIWTEIAARALASAR